MSVYYVHICGDCIIKHKFYLKKDITKHLFPSFYDTSNCVNLNNLQVDCSYIPNNYIQRLI